MTRSLLALLLAAAPFLTASQSGVADSRLFSIRADTSGTTIDQAFVNGQPLAVAGKSEGLTFFRIDDPVGVVTCRQQLVVVASTGERQEADIDLCAQNWQVSVHLTGSPVGRSDPDGAAPPTAASPQPPDAAVITAPTQLVTIVANDPAVRIDGIVLDGQPTPIVNRQGNRVAISVPGGPGKIRCDRDLSINLSDGRTLEREANICEHNWSVLAKISADDAAKLPSRPPPLAPPAPVAPAASPPVANAAVAAPPPSPVPPVPPAPVAAPSETASIANAVPAAPPPDAAQAPATGEVWSLEPGDQSLTISYGIPGKMGQFAARCQPGSGGIAMRTFQQLPNGHVEGPLLVTLGAGQLTRTYPAVKAPLLDKTDGIRLEFSTSPADSLWQALVNEPELWVQMGQAPKFSISLQGSAQQFAVFLRACAGQPDPKVVAGGIPNENGSVIAGQSRRGWHWHGWHWHGWHWHGWHWHR
jgi:hypothetical protein